ncbi:hypothetical protein J4P02_02950 [Pseudomonas sp. NFXW11]|uniref:DUF6360 family protein n=1 Tax=Pseudomonas sp. NFXW11 TaxID=2819531 RepID=UPI003CE9A825
MAIADAGDYFESSDGEVRLWIEQGSSIQIKALSEQGDPVELNVQQALELARVLQVFAGRLQE